MKYAMSFSVKEGGGEKCAMCIVYSKAMKFMRLSQMQRQQSLKHLKRKRILNVYSFNFPPTPHVPLPSSHSPRSTPLIPLPSSHSPLSSSHPPHSPQTVLSLPSADGGLWWWCALAHLSPQGKVNCPPHLRCRWGWTKFRKLSIQQIMLLLWLFFANAPPKCNVYCIINLHRVCALRLRSLQKDWKVGLKWPYIQKLPFLLIKIDFCQ